MNNDNSTRSDAETMVDAVASCNNNNNKSNDDINAGDNDAWDIHRSFHTLLPAPVRMILQQQKQQQTNNSVSLWDQLIMIEPAKSAQQCVWILTFAPWESTCNDQNDDDDDNDGDNHGVSAAALPSRETIVKANRSSERADVVIEQQQQQQQESWAWQQAIERGRGRLVLRIWKGASRWWNCNHPDHPQALPTTTLHKNMATTTTTTPPTSNSVWELARSEVAGYRTARYFLERQSLLRQKICNSNEMNNSSSDNKEMGDFCARQIQIPAVLYVSFEQEQQQQHEQQQQDSVQHGSITATASSCQVASINEHPWAILEYVGPYSTLFRHTDHSSRRLNISNNNHNTRTSGCDGNINNINDDDSNVACSNHFDSRWVDSMIVIRHEFGFDEPHPRWGRVPADYALTYARQVLHQAIIPLHCAILDTWLGQNETRTINHNNNNIHINNRMVDLSTVRRVMKGLSQPNMSQQYSTVETSCPHGYSYRDMIAVYREKFKVVQQATATPHQGNHNSHHQDQQEDGHLYQDQQQLKLQQFIAIMDQALDRLDREAVEIYHLYNNASNDTPPCINDSNRDNIDMPYPTTTKTSRTMWWLPPVLCHMDWQPQNIIFRQSCNFHSSPRQQQGQEQHGKKYDPTIVVQDSTIPINHNNNGRIVSILDWEEAAWADPRFDLLLLGRKVCANMTQAVSLWNEYQHVVLDRMMNNNNMMSIQPKQQHQHDQDPSRRIRKDPSQDGHNHDDDHDNHNDHDHDSHIHCCLWQLGPLEPWIRLETVHTLLSLLLQVTAGGGRNPWEYQSDLFCKMERECTRLKQSGWT